MKKPIAEQSSIGELLAVCVHNSINIIFIFWMWNGRITLNEEKIKKKKNKK